MGLPFEQLPKEGAKPFAAFAIYLSLGPERSLAVVGQKLGKSVGLMERWSRRFDWPSRVQAHAAHLAIVEREATEAMARGKAAEWLTRQTEVREREWRLHEKCIAAAEKALDAFMAKSTVYANLGDIARIAEIASRLGRLASGMATDKTEISGLDGGPIQVEFEVALRKIYSEPLPGEVVDVEAKPVTPAALPEAP